jgi:hypothetical protein
LDAGAAFELSFPGGIVDGASGIFGLLDFDGGLPNSPVAAMNLGGFGQLVGIVLTAAKRDEAVAPLVRNPLSGTKPATSFLMISRFNLERS